MSKQQNYDKALTRLTIIFQCLYEGEILSVSELADEFNVSTKTIQRDFNERLIRFPIEKEGRKWKMKKGFKLTKERTPEEILVIDMLENIAQGIGKGFGTKAKHLFSKLQNQSQNHIYSKTIIEDISDYLELFLQTEKAIDNKQIVTFTFNKKIRQVKPYKIVSFDGYWYLFCEDIDASKLKTFYFKNISNLKVTNETFLAKEKAQRTLKNAINSWFEPNKEPFEVKLHVNQEIAKYFHRRPLANSQVIEKTYQDGSMDMIVFATSDTEILHEVKKWMPNLVVTSPQRVALQAKEIAESFLQKQTELLTS